MRPPEPPPSLFFQGRSLFKCRQCTVFQIDTWHVSHGHMKQATAAFIKINIGLLYGFIYWNHFQYAESAAFLDQIRLGMCRRIMHWATSMYQLKLWSKCQLAYVMFDGNELHSICSCANPLMFVPWEGQLLPCCWIQNIRNWCCQSQ